jgi:hypothetical protein
MDVSIKCVCCGEILRFTAMTKQAVAQAAKQALDWKVVAGLKKVDWIPMCEGCGSMGRDSFCCPKCDSKDIWGIDILKSGKLIHSCS